MTAENRFERQAKRILRYLKNDKRYDQSYMPRPFFIEFTGSPSSGKTTTITELDKFFRRQGFRVWRPQEGAEVIRHISRSTPVYNLRTGLYALQILIDESVGHKYDIVIFDRAIFDAYCWMLYWKSKDKLSLEETVTIQQFFLSRFWADMIDAVYFMTCDPKVAMERELRIALSQKMGETSNPTTIETLVNRYKGAYDLLSSTHPQLRLLDTTKMNEQEVVRYIAAQILDTLEEKTKK